MMGQIGNIVYMICRTKTITPMYENFPVQTSDFSVQAPFGIPRQRCSPLYGVLGLVFPTYRDFNLP
jgi:hypothetical protein